MSIVYKVSQLEFICVMCMCRIKKRRAPPSLHTLAESLLLSPIRRYYASKSLFAAPPPFITQSRIQRVPFFTPFMLSRGSSRSRCYLLCSSLERERRAEEGQIERGVGETRPTTDLAARGSVFFTSELRKYGN
jgi:hypothetical protein